MPVQAHSPHGLLIDVSDIEPGDLTAFDRILAKAPGRITRGFDNRMRNQESHPSPEHSHGTAATTPDTIRKSWVTLQ
jgi:hypothetical protein